jgi:DNA-binding transcriptional ArsR family regulator
MMAEDDELVWKALSDPTRRGLLDLLRDGPRTTGELAEAFPDVTRFAVMKHLGRLQEAELVIVEARGRQRWHYLNAVPIRRIYDRWIRPFAEEPADSLLRIKDLAEGR